MTGSRSDVQFGPLPEDDPKQRCPDISKAKRILGWEPKIDLRTRLQLSLPYFKTAVQTARARLDGIAPRNTRSLSSPAA